MQILSLAAMDAIPLKHLLELIICHKINKYKNEPGKTIGA
jgi:hypothetical protein